MSDTELAGDRCNADRNGRADEKGCFWHSWYATTKILRSKCLVLLTGFQFSFYANNSLTVASLDNVTT